MFRDQFELEADALWQRLRVLAEANPRLGSLYARDADPRVARLVQSAAFAFAAASTRLDNDDQALVRPLVARALPECLRPRPSSTILEFSPSLSRASDHQRSVVAGQAGGLSAPFEVMWPTAVAPFALTRASVDRLNARTQVLRLTLSGQGGAELATVLPRTLRFFVNHAPLSTSLDLLHALRTAEDAPQLRTFGSNGKPLATTALPKKGALAWVRIDTDEAPLVSAPGDRFRSGTLLRDLFAFPESFCFFDLSLGGFREPKVTTIELVLPLGHVVEGVAGTTLEHVRLFCAPATNQYREEMDPVRPLAGERQWTLTVSRRPHAEILHVQSLYWVPARDARRRIDVPSWEAPAEPDGLDDAQTYYLLEHALAPSTSRTELRLAFATLRELYAPSPGPVVQGQLLASDGALTDRMGLADVGSKAQGVTNITRVSASQRASIGQNHAWRMSAYARMPPARLVQKESLQEFLAIHEVRSQAGDDVRVRQLPIRSVQHRREHRLKDGVIQWGDRFSVDADALGNTPGEAWLTGSILSFAIAEREERLRFSRLSVLRDGERFADYRARDGARLPFPLG
jgi:type VI secretion system protein ImpG